MHEDGASDLRLARKPAESGCFGLCGVPSRPGLLLSQGVRV